jgi:type IV secretory pathway VirB10-like protein
MFLAALPVYAQSGSDPWDNAVNVLKTAFTGTIATGLSLVAIVVGGLMFAYGEGQSKKTLAGIVFGVDMEPAEDSGVGAGLERRPAPESAADNGAEDDGQQQRCHAHRSTGYSIVHAAQWFDGSDDTIAAHGAATRSGSGAEKAMAFKARFASNLVSAEDVASRPLADVSGTTESTAARSPSASQAPAPQPAVAATDKKRAPEINVNSAQGQPYVVFEGTTIDTVLVNRLDGEFAGPLKVMVTNPIYSQDRQHLLIPEGTFILGLCRRSQASARSASPSPSTGY